MALTVDEIERLMVLMVTHRVDLVKVDSVVLQKSSHVPAVRPKAVRQPAGDGPSPLGVADGDDDEDDDLLYASAGS